MAADGGEGGGSFWTTFGGPAQATTLERLLQTPGCSVEALLDEEEILQEFKAGNEKLVARLCEPDAARALVELVTLEPPKEASSERCYRYPFVAVELMSCGPAAFFQAWVRPDHTEALDALWDFLEACAPAEINPVLAGYFARTAALILAKHPTEVVEYLKLRGADNLLERFLERLHLRSIAELFARLLCVEQPGRMVFQTERLVHRLLARLEDDNPSSDAEENITLVILELLAQKDSLCFSDELLQQFTEEQAVSFLVNHIFNGRPGSVSAASSILSSVVFHTYVALKGVNLNATLSPLSPAQALLVGEEDNVGFTVDESSLTEAAPIARAHQSHSPPVSPQATSRGGSQSRWLESRSILLMQEICQHLPRVRELLDVALQRKTLVSTPIGQVSAVSSSTLEVINLVVMLARTGCPGVLDTVFQEQLLLRCLEVFFRHPWCTLLHNSVKLLMSEIMSSTDGIRPKLVLSALEEGGLLERLVAEYEAEEQEVRSAELAGRRKCVRTGYMGHVHAICCELRDYSTVVPECGAALAANNGWSTVVLPALSATSRLLSENLGGGIQREDRGLASSSAAGSTASLHSVADNSSSSMEADFVLDDLSDEVQHLDIGQSGDADLVSPAQAAAERAIRAPPGLSLSTGSDGGEQSEPPVLPVLVGASLGGPGNTGPGELEASTTSGAAPWVDPNLWALPTTSAPWVAEFQGVEEVVQTQAPDSVIGAGGGMAASSGVGLASSASTNAPSGGGWNASFVSPSGVVDSANRVFADFPEPVWPSTAMNDGTDGHPAVPTGFDTPGIVSNPWPTDFPTVAAPSSGASSGGDLGTENLFALLGAGDSTIAEPLNPSPSGSGGGGSSGSRAPPALPSHPAPVDVLDPLGALAPYQLASPAPAAPTTSAVCPANGGAANGTAAASWAEFDPFCPPEASAALGASGAPGLSAQGPPARSTSAGLDNLDDLAFLAPLWSGASLPASSASSAPLPAAPAAP